MSFSFHLDDHSHPPVLTLTGHIDEHADFQQISVPKADWLTVDLKDIDQINSLGIRSWITWINHLQHVQHIFLRKCPALIVHQINVLEGFKPLGGVIESVYVPYYCESCDHTTEYLAERGRDFRELSADSSPLVHVPKTVPCEKCNMPVEPDVVLSKFFKFLSKR